MYIRFFRAVLGVFCTVLLLSACGNDKPPPYKGLKIGKPYQIYGRWYKPKYEPNYDEIGMASWYGPGFHGKQAAIGEIYDQEALTAAHKTLPLSSIVRVTNLQNGKSAILRINDRGPFAYDRIIDLSKASAEKLGIYRAGTAKVRVQFLDDATREYVESRGGKYQFASKSEPEPAEKPQATTNQPAEITSVSSQDLQSPQKQDQIATNSSPFVVVENDNSRQIFVNPTNEHREIIIKRNTASKISIQVATFSIKENADKILKTISSIQGLQNAAIIESNIGEKTLYKVILQAIESEDQAQEMLEILVENRITGGRIIK